MELLIKIKPGESKAPKQLMNFRHFEVREAPHFYEVNMVVDSGGNEEVRKELEYYSKEIIETKGYASPALLYGSMDDNTVSELITVYNYEFVPLFDYLVEFDCWRHHAYYVKNNLVKGAIQDLIDMVNDEYMSDGEGSIFHIRSEFFRNLRSLSEQWH